MKLLRVPTLITEYLEHSVNCRLDSLRVYLIKGYKGLKTATIYHFALQEALLKWLTTLSTGLCYFYLIRKKL